MTCHLGPLVAGRRRHGDVHGARDLGRGGNERHEHRDDLERGDAPVRDVPAGCPALPDFNPADSTDSATVNVNPEADLSLTKTASTTNPAVDDEVDYTLTASNAGPNDATGVTIVDSLPPGLAFIDATPGCDNQNGTITCDLGTVPAGGSGVGDRPNPHHERDRRDGGDEPRDRIQ